MTSVPPWLRSPEPQGVCDLDQSISAGSRDPARVSPVPLHCKEMIPLNFFSFKEESRCYCVGCVYFFFPLVCYSLPFLNTLEQEVQ